MIATHTCLCRSFYAGNACQYCAEGYEETNGDCVPKSLSLAEPDSPTAGGETPIVDDKPKDAPANASAGDNGLSGGAIAGIVVGSIAAVAVVTAIVLMVLKGAAVAGAAGAATFNTVGEGLGETRGSTYLACHPALPSGMVEPLQRL